MLWQMEQENLDLPPKIRVALVSRRCAVLSEKRAYEAFLECSEPIL